MNIQQAKEEIRNTLRAYLQKDGEGKMHDLLQKATGWMLREAGKRDQARLVGYLRQKWNCIPATMRRYACEKLSDII